MRVWLAENCAISPGRRNHLISGWRRTTPEAALEAVRIEQRERLRRAGAQLAANRPALRGVTVRLDLIALSPGKWPRHIPDAWPDGY